MAEWVKGIILRLFYYQHFIAGPLLHGVVVVVVGGPCDYCVNPSPNNWALGIFRLSQTFGTGLGDCWDRGLGLGLGLDKNLM